MRGLEQLEELRRPGSTRCRSRARSAARPCAASPRWRRSARRGHRPLSTLGWEQNLEWVREGYATGAAKGPTTADLPDHAYWEEWFPADWVSEMREQIRLWFYSQHFMSVVLTGRAPYRRVLGYEKMLDETGREMHGSWGNMIQAEEAFERMGADVMRWFWCAAARPQPALRLRPRERDQAQAADTLELGSLPRRLRADRGLHARLGRSRRRRGTSARPLARTPGPAGRRGDRRITRPT